MNQKLLLLDGHNFKDYPLGGQLTYQKTFLSYPHKSYHIQLFGLSVDADEPAGQWGQRLIHGNRYDFFPVHQYKRKNGKHLIPHSFRYTWGTLAFRKVILNQNAAFIYAHNPEMLLPLINQPTDAKFIYHIHGSPLRKLKYSKYPFLRAPWIQSYYVHALKQVFQKTSLLIWSSQDALKEAVNLFPDIRDKSEVIPNYTDLTRFYPRDKSSGRAKYGFDAYGKIGVYLGRLSAIKGLEIMFKAIKILKEAQINLCLLVIGDGEEKPKLQLLARALGIGEQIKFLGSRSWGEIPELLSIADFAMFASYSEGFPVSIIECMAAGLPVISTDVGDINKIVFDRVNGRLVPHPDVHSYASILKELIHADLVAMGKESVGLSKQYSPEHTIPIIYNHLERL